MKHLTLLLAIVAIGAADAEIYRLKYTATVEVLDDSGKVVEVKKLKAKTLLQDVSSNDAQSAGRLTPGDMSPSVLRLNAPATAVIRARVSLDDFYVSEFTLDKHWSIDCWGMNDDWSMGAQFHAYALKSSPVGKRLFKFVKDGKEHKCIVKLKHLGYEMAMIEDFEPYVDSKE